jgi:RNA polymerase sigma-70 factor (ECF subfamily)
MLCAETTLQTSPPGLESNSLDPALADERALLQGLLADDAAAWREFNLRYSRLVYRCITRITARFTGVLGSEDVREIYAMLCVQLLANDKRKLRSFEPDRGNKLGSWIGMLTIHTTYDFLRQARREPRRACMSEAENLSAGTEDPAEEYEMRERARIVASILEGFSARDRTFVNLYFGDGLSPEQVAKRMGISIKTVYSKRHKIQTRLEALLAARPLAA